MAFYRRPSLPAGVIVHTVVPDNTNGEVLNDSTPVIVFNRKPEPYVDMYDGRRYTLPPGFIDLRYCEALHFKGRSVVPGSRNPETGKQDHYIVIVDAQTPPDHLITIGEAQFRRQQQLPEAIDRASMTSQAARSVQTIKTTAAHATIAEGRGLEGNSPSSDVPDDAMAPVHDAQQEQARDAAAAASDGYAPEAVTVGGRRRR